MDRPLSSVGRAQHFLLKRKRLDMKDEIIIRYYLGKSPEEIAKELGLSLEIVKLSISLEILKQTFRKYMSE